MAKCGLFEVMVRLISHTASQGVADYNGRHYLISLGWLTYIREDLYCINISYLTRERRTFL